MPRLLLSLVTLALLLPAVPAQAGHAYGVLDVRDTLLTFEVEGHALRAAALRTRLYCDEGGWVDFAAKFAIARHGRQVLIPLRSGPDELRYRVHVVWTDLTFAGRLTITRLADRKPAVHLDMTAEDCAARVHRLARREPGVLYTGATDDDEPVWIRRLATGVEWVSGFGTECKPRGFVQGLHADFAPAAGDAFGWSGLIDGFSYGADDDRYGLAVQLAGAFAGPSADGELRMLATGGGWQADRCDTGARTWHAVTG